MKKEKLPKLTSRLNLIAKKVRIGKSICDIGTDHCYLPIYLVLKGKIPNAIASDINEGPLKKAKSSIIDYNCENKISLILSDGFNNINENLVEDVIICGMGGELIAEIISKAPFLKSGDRQLFLQPMTKAQELKKYLFENGFEILDEEVAKEGKKLYVVMTVKAGKTTKYKESELIFSKKLLKRNTQLEKQYLEKLILKYEKSIKGMKKGNAKEKLQKTNDLLISLKKMLEMMQNAKSK